MRLCRTADAKLEDYLQRLDQSDAAALLYIALWINMTGAPGMLNQWLLGTPELGVAPPAGPSVTRVNVESYLHASCYFRLHPRNFTHMSDSVDAGLVVLLAGAA